MKTNVYSDTLGFQCLDHIEHQTNDLYLTRCGIQKCTENYSWGPKKRPQYHMHFILEGSGYFEINQVKYRLEKGQIFLIPPNTLTRYYADKKDPWTYAFISFLGNKAEKYTKQAGFYSDSYVRNCILPPEDFSSLISEMMQTHQLTITNELRRVSLLFSLFALLTATNPSPEHTNKSHDYLPETYFEYALEYIERNYAQSIKIQDIADYIGITRSYLFYLFNKKINLSPQKYLQRYRIKKAMQMLASPDILVKDIAQNVGYEDSLAFSKMFHNATGYSPSAYRKHITGLSE